MMSSAKKALLTLLSVVLITVFFGLKGNSDWIKTRVLKPITDIEDQLVYMEPEERMAYRYSNSYITSNTIIEAISKADSFKADLKDLLLLLPPKDYLKEKKVEYPIVEPVVFYYMTGHKAIWANQKGAEKCNYAVLVDHNRLIVRKLDSTSRSLLLREYRTYKISL